MQNFNDKDKFKLNNTLMMIIPPVQFMNKTTDNRLTKPLLNNEKWNILIIMLNKI